MSSVITAYRRQRRNKSNKEFANLLGIKNNELDENEQKYLFVNTADILILNTCKQIKNKNKLKKITQKHVVEAIHLLTDLIQSDNSLKQMTPASLTKNQKVYSEMKSKFN